LSAAFRPSSRSCARYTLPIPLHRALQYFVMAENIARIQCRGDCLQARRQPPLRRRANSMKPGSWSLDLNNRSTRCAILRRRHRPTPERQACFQAPGLPKKRIILDLLPAFGGHLADPSGLSSARAMLCICQSRLTVRSDIPRTAAVSSTLRPEKYLNSTTGSAVDPVGRACRGLRRAPPGRPTKPLGPPATGRGAVDSGRASLAGVALAGMIYQDTPHQIGCNSKE